MRSNVIDRRRMMFGTLATGALALGLIPAGRARTGRFPVTRSEEEWRRTLTARQFRILRQHGTERPFSSPLLREKRPGWYACAADGNRLFASSTKYDSGTGWPSFYRALPGAVGTSADYQLGYRRTEVHCARCGGHLGHLFNDGPAPTGLRYCMNGDAMLFVPR